VRTLRWATSAVLGTVALGLTLMAWWIADADPYGAADLATVLTIVVLGTQAAGLRVTQLRPGRWSGVLIQLIGIEALVGAGRQGDLGWLVPVFAGSWLALCAAPVLLVWDRVSVLPGVSPGRAEPVLRILSGLAIAACVALAVPIVATAHGREEASPLWWNVVPGSRASWDAAVLMAIAAAAATVAVVTAALALLVRFRRSSAVERSANRPVVVTACTWSVVTLVARWVMTMDPAPLVGPSGNLTSLTALVIMVLPLLSVVGFLAAVLWFELVVPRLRRTADGLVLARQPSDIRDLVRWLLADPSARPLFPDPDGDGWIDPDGRRFAVDPTDPDRALTEFRRAGQVVGAIEHDAQLAAHPEAVELVGTLAGLALEEVGIAARTNADLDRTRRLTARLVGAADEPRDELAAALRCGPVRELRNLAQRVWSGRELDEAADSLQSIAGEVRALSHGLLPPTLLDRGLRAALPYATVECGRQSPSVEVTAFLAARDDPGAVITQSDGCLEIRLSRSPSLQPLLDRIDVLGGSVDGSRILLPVGS
jgi:hypothetical protein